MMETLDQLLWNDEFAPGADVRWISQGEWSADRSFDRIRHPNRGRPGGTKARCIGRRVDLDDSAGGWAAFG